MFAVLGSFIVCAVHYLAVQHGAQSLFSFKPFYNPATFSVRSIAGATSFAALTYLGFDAVTTLAEDVKNPRRNVLLSAVVVCAFTGVFGGLLVYLAHLAWPDYSSYPGIETAFIDVTQRVGGVVLFQAMATVLVIANVGAGMTTQVGAARLLFGMGRDNVIPRWFFAYLHPKRNTPNRNIWLIGILAYLGAQVMSYELTAEILNFGAFLGFMGVNLAVIWQFGIRSTHDGPVRLFADFVLPALGFLFCAVIWWGLGAPAKIAGGIWFVIGLVVLANQTAVFRQPLALPDPASYE
jgi:putrescine importer